MYLNVRRDASNILIKAKQHPPPGEDASTAEAAPGRVGRDEQSQARRANTTPNGGPHLELGRSTLKTWSKSDFSITETTWQTYFISIHIPVVVTTVKFAKISCTYLYRSPRSSGTTA